MNLLRYSKSRFRMISLIIQYFLRTILYSSLPVVFIPMSLTQQSRSIDFCFCLRIYLSWQLHGKLYSVVLLTHYLSKASRRITPYCSFTHVLFKNLSKAASLAYNGQVFVRTQRSIVVQQTPKHQIHIPSDSPLLTCRRNQFSLAFAI